MADIQNQEDITQLVKAFYAKAIEDPVIGHYFTDVISINWDEHIKVIISFWGNVLFSSGGYKGGMLFKHFNLHHLSAFKPKHFERWLTLWGETVDRLFEGPMADEAKFRAKSIAVIMQTKLGIYEEEEKNKSGR